MPRTHSITYLGLGIWILGTCGGCQHAGKELAMVHRVKPDQRDMTLIEVAGAKVQVSDPIVGPNKNLAAGFTEYLAPSRFDWTFDYDEVFFMVEGYLEVHVTDQKPLAFEVGDLGYIPKGTESTIVVPEAALLVHITQPAWRD